MQTLFDFFDTACPCATAAERRLILLNGRTEEERVIRVPYTPRLRLTLLAPGEGRKEVWTYIFVSLPAAITGPVGMPVGDPPGGSNETASVASGVTRPARSKGTSSVIG
jgi:hypothetical protein